MALDTLTSEIGALLGHEVRLIRRALPSGSIVYLVVPIERRRLRTAFWQEVQLDGGAWDSPARACIGFAASMHRWRRRPSSRAAMYALQKLLATGPRPARDVAEEMTTLGFGPSLSERTARLCCVMRSKLGNRGPWMWSLPSSPGSHETTATAPSLTHPGLPIGDPALAAETSGPASAPEGVKA
jgi:hypothetical protein